MIAEETGITAADIKAYNELCAMQTGPNHHRLKMKAIVDRCRDASVGRALVGGKLHLRTDTFGNPEIVYDKNYVISRFVIGGLRFHVPYWYNSNDIGSLYSTLVNLYTDFSFEGRQNSIKPKNLAKMVEESGLTYHDISVRHCRKAGCRICQLTDEATHLADIEKEKYRNFIDQRTIKPVSDENKGRDFPLIPYSTAKELNLEILPDIVENEWRKISGVSPRTGKPVRTWKRREKEGKEGE